MLVIWCFETYAQTRTTRYPLARLGRAWAGARGDVPPRAHDNRLFVQRVEDRHRLDRVLARWLPAGVRPGGNARGIGGEPGDRGRGQHAVSPGGNAGGDGPRRVAAADAP